MNRALASFFGLLGFLIPVSASANVSGLGGYTGKPLNGGQGESCNQCHGGGTPPTLTINGPATLNAGQTGDYTLVITTSAALAGAGISASNGTTFVPGTGLRASFEELVQDGEQTVTGGSRSFPFKMTASPAGGPLRIWAVGLAANNNNNDSGDSSAQTTRDITVVGGTKPVADAGTSSGNTSNGGTDAGSSGKSPDGGSGDDDDDDATSSGGTRRPVTSSSSSGGCSTGGAGSMDLAGLGAIAVAATLVVLGRRRPRSVRP